MISSVGLVPPLVLPLPIQYAAVAQVTAVTPAADPMAVEVALQPDIIQTPRHGDPLTLDTIVAPHEAKVRYLPAGDLLVEGTWPAAVGPFGADAWVIDALADKSAIAPLLPPTVPAPVYWVLEGVAPLSVEDPANPGGVLDQWLDGAAPGVHPKARQCHDRTDPADQADTPDNTWKQAMLAGRWSEPVPAETVLGLAALDGVPGRLRIWTFGADGTPLPAAGILDAFAAADPELLPTHPVVAGCHALLDNLPVRFYLRFELWAVELSSPTDSKGIAQSLQPAAVTLVDANTGADIAGTTWTWLGSGAGSGVLEVPRVNVFGAAFSVRAEFPPGLRVRLSRTEPERFCAIAPLVWSTAGWTAEDRVTPGNWLAFDGVLIGTQTQPAVFSVGTKVRISAGYQQQRLDWFAPSPITHLDTRRVTAGHTVRLYQGGVNPVDEFRTDDDGEVSGVSFTVLPGTPVTVTLPRRLDLPAVNGGNATTLVALDDPVGSVFPDDQFHGVNALSPITFPFVPPFSTGTIGRADLIIDADTAGGRHTADAAAFHALKYAKFTHDATTLLKTDSLGLPQRHEFVIRPGAAITPVTYAWLPGNPVGTAGPARTETTLSAPWWFQPNIVIHEYAHGMIAWLSSQLQSVARYDPINYAATTIFHRRTVENGPSHNAWLITNSGTALDEGLPEFFEFLFGYEGSFLGMPSLLWAQMVTPPPGQGSWPKYDYQVTDPTGHFVQLASDMGRRVEGVLAWALFEYIRQATTFDGFTVVPGDTDRGSRPPLAYLNDWAATVPATRLTQLQRLFRWLFTDAVTAVGGGPPAGWTGVWPPPPAVPEPPYPTVYDYLRQLQASDPAGAAVPPTPEESFQHLLDTCLLPWNLEPFDPAEPKPPLLDPDWLP